MTEEINSNHENERAGTFALIISALFPIIGVIIYFVQKESVSNPRAYLKAALIGFIIGMTLRMVF